MSADVTDDPGDIAGSAWDVGGPTNGKRDSPAPASRGAGGRTSETGLRRERERELGAIWSADEEWDVDSAEAELTERAERMSDEP